MALRLLSKTYWRGTQIRFRRPVEDVAGTPVAIDAQDGARLHGVWWTASGNAMPRVAVIAAHPRVDFSEHHTFPDLLDAGYGCLGANLRSLNNDADCLHEKLLVDLAAYMHWLKERGVEKIVLLGNSGGGSLFSFYQSQAKKPAADRLEHMPDGRAILLDRTELIPGDGIVFMAAHAGQGRIMNEVIDPRWSTKPIRCAPIRTGYVRPGQRVPSAAEVEPLCAGLRRSFPGGTAGPGPADR